MNIKEYVDEAHKTAQQHGWHDEKMSENHFLMLIITEIVELIQADRKNKHTRRELFELRLKVSPGDPDNRFIDWFEPFVKNTFEDELADICIRTFDLIGEFNVKIEQLEKIHSEINQEFDIDTLTEQCFNVIGAIIECDNLPINCRNILIVAEHWAKLYEIDLEWHIKQKMRYNRLRQWRHGNMKY